MKEIDFLPEWYREGRRRRGHMKRQYALLIVFFLAIMTYNTVSTHRISKANAELATLEDRRFWAEGVMHEYHTLSKQLGAHQAKVATVQKVDARIDMAAVLAEISYIIGDRVILSRLEFISEPAVSEPKTANRSGAAVRSAAASRPGGRTVSLGPLRFRVALAGVAVDSSEVGSLVRRLEDSPYFRQVHPLFRDNTIQVDVVAPQTPPATGMDTRRNDKRSLSVTEFEITCYLANYEERDKR